MGRDLDDRAQARQHRRLQRTRAEINRETIQGTSATNYPNPLNPFELRSLRLRNRIVHAAMNTHMAAGTRVTQPLIDYHAAARH